MSRHHYELLDYRHKNLIWELNEFMISVKANLADLPVKRPKPDFQYMDDLQARVNNVLKQDAKPIRRG